MQRDIYNGNSHVQQVSVSGTRERRFSIFGSSRFAIIPELSARSNSRYNGLKSVTDCFKRGLALSAAALAPENCLVLFPRATHLIKHARFSCSPDPSHLSFFHSAGSPLSFTIATSTPARECTRTQAHVYTHTLYVPVLFSFPFLFLSLGHASTPFPHPRSSFEFCGKRVSLSSFLPPFLPVSLRWFFSLLFSFTRQSPDLSPSHPTRGCYPLLFLSLSDIPLPTRAKRVSLTRSLSTTLSAELPTASETAK